MTWDNYHDVKDRSMCQTQNRYRMDYPMYTGRVDKISFTAHYLISESFTFCQNCLHDYKTFTLSISSHWSSTELAWQPHVHIRVPIQGSMLTGVDHLATRRFDCRIDWEEWLRCVKGASPPPTHILWVVDRDYISETIIATWMNPAPVCRHCGA